MKILATVGFFFLLESTGFSQQQKTCWNPVQRGDSSLSIAAFDSMVKHYILILEQKKSVDTIDYIRMVKLNNTVFFNRNFDNTPRCWPEHDSLYAQFNRLTEGRYFFDTLTRYLGLCIPNRGMGCYYAAHGLDFGGGGPNNRSLYRIIL